MVPATDFHFGFVWASFESRFSAIFTSFHIFWSLAKLVPPSTDWRGALDTACWLWRHFLGHSKPQSLGLRPRCVQASISCFSPLFHAFRGFSRLIPSSKGFNWLKRSSGHQFRDSENTSESQTKTDCGFRFWASIPCLQSFPHLSRYFRLHSSCNWLKIFHLAEIRSVFGYWKMSFSRLARVSNYFAEEIISKLPLSDKVNSRLV